MSTGCCYHRQPIILYIKSKGNIDASKKKKFAHTIYFFPISLRRSKEFSLIRSFIKLLQFSHFSKLMQSYNMSSSLPAIKDSHQFPKPVMTNFPQPTRPLNNYYLEPSQLPQTSHPINEEDNLRFQSCTPEERFPSNVPDSCGPTTTTVMDDGEKETMEELLRAILELYAKLPPRIRSQVKLDRFNIPSNILKDLKVESTATRGVEGSMEELSRKLERFKIRTVQLGGIVKEEDKS